MEGVRGILLHHNDECDHLSLEQRLMYASQFGMIFIDESNPHPPMIMKLDESGRIINGNLEQENVDGRC